jgi:hypothetical protein
MLRGHHFVCEAKDSWLLQNVLNEVLHGFDISNFDDSIGMNRSELEQLLGNLSRLLTRRSDGVELKLDRRQTRAFRNALHETLRELGVEEFHARTGFDFQEGKDILRELDELLTATSQSELS